MTLPQKLPPCLERERDELRSMIEERHTDHVKYLRQIDELKARAELAEKAAPGSYRQLAEENNSLREVAERLAGAIETCVAATYGEPEARVMAGVNATEALAAWAEFKEER